jgi:hypothetical protein
MKAQETSGLKEMTEAEILNLIKSVETEARNDIRNIDKKVSDLAVGLRDVSTSVRGLELKLPEMLSESLKDRRGQNRPDNSIEGMRWAIGIIFTLGVSLVAMPLFQMSNAMTDFKTDMKESDKVIMETILREVRRTTTESKERAKRDKEALDGFKSQYKEDMDHLRGSQTRQWQDIKKNGRDIIKSQEQLKALKEDVKEHKGKHVVSRQESFFSHHASQVRGGGSVS